MATMDPIGLNLSQKRLRKHLPSIESALELKAEQKSQRLQI